MEADLYVAELMANRDEPIPVLKPPQSREEDDTAAAPNTATTSEQAPDSQTNNEKASRGSSVSVSFQDRVFAKLFEQLIPPVDEDGSGGSNAVLSGSSSTYLERPGFSLAMMSNNFRRFNARIGVVFVFQARAIRLFSWRTPAHTLSFLAIYTFLCVYPYLLLALPLCLILLFVMVPAYLARHPPPPTEDAGPGAHAMALTGPALAPPRVVKPAPELSHDFFRNMRDLQNSMADFATLHDVVLAALTPWTNFADESRASAAFLGLTVTAFGLALLAPLIPFRAVALLGGWALIGSAHPKVQQATANLYTKRAQSARNAAQSQLQAWVQSDFEFDDAPEILEVEVFELQRRRQPSSFTSTFAPPISPTHQVIATGTSSPGMGPAPASEYEAWLFSPTPWEPQTPARRAGARPKGTRFFEDVRPPAGWDWAGKKWVLDPGSGSNGGGGEGDALGADWVAARLLRGLEVEQEGERWVYDLVEVSGATEAAAAANASGASQSSTARSRKQPPPSPLPLHSPLTPRTPRSVPPAMATPRSVPADMAEPDYTKDAVVFRGEWRRRRWVRSVKRAKVYGSGVKVVSDVSAGPARGKMREEAKESK